MEQKKLVLIGPVGYGKSTTGCTLLRKRDAFTKGSDINRITLQFQAHNGNGLHVIDCPGIADPSNDTIFQKNFLDNKEHLFRILPIDAFILVIKFDKDQSIGFNLAAQEYFRYFGRVGIKSLLILCIQGNQKKIYSETEFRRIFFNTDGYKFLVGKNNKEAIPFCLWDNFSSAYYDMQQNELLSEVAKLQKIDRIKLEFFVDLVENDIGRINELNLRDEKINELKKKDNEKNKLEQKAPVDKFSSLSPRNRYNYSHKIFTDLFK